MKPIGKTDDFSGEELSIGNTSNILIASNRIGKDTFTVYEVISKLGTNPKDTKFLMKLWDKLIGIR